MTEPVQPSAQRIWDHCEALATLSELDGGLTRVYLSDEQRRANELVLGWMREAGMSARLDAAGNCVGRYEGERPGLPALVLGSHLDTVRDAGQVRRHARRDRRRSSASARSTRAGGACRSRSR